MGRKYLVACFSLYLLSHIALGNFPSSYPYILLRDTFYYPLSTLLGLSQGWGFYSGNLNSTNILRFRYELADGEKVYVDGESGRPGRPWRFVIGNSENDIASNTSNMGRHILEYYCRHPQEGVQSPLRIAVETRNVPFPRMGVAHVDLETIQYKENYIVSCKGDQ